MTIQICRNLISLSLKNPNPLLCLCKPHLSISSSLLAFFLSFSSSSGKEQPNRRIPVAEYLLERPQFSPEVVSKVSSSSSLKYLQNPEKSDSILLFLEQSGFSKTHIEHVVKRFPQVLSAKLDHTFKPKIQVFQDLGFSTTDIVEIISADPWILTHSAGNRIGPSILALKSILGSNEAVSKVLKISGWFLKCDLDKTLIPNIEFMKSCGISLSNIVKFLYKYPRFFLYKQESIKEFVKRVDAFGFDRESMSFLHATRIISSMTVENWEHKLELLRSLGFSEDDIGRVFRRTPQVLSVSETKIKETIQVLLGTGKFDISLIVNNSWLLIVSVEKRLKPRLQVLEILESKNLLLKTPRLTSVLRVCDKRFFEEFVLPYSNEVGKVYVPDEISQSAGT